MIASWMLYAFLVSALVTIAALALDQVAGARQWPRRAVWFGALLLSIAWPFATVVRRLLPQPLAPVRVLPFTITVQSARFIASGDAMATRAALVDRGLVGLWCVLSVLLLFRLSQGMLILRRNRDAWRQREVDGTTVRVSQNVGPAVVGLRSMDVVLPEWILALDEPLRAIVLRHEEEHRMARDPYLLFVAAVAVALMPWNLALWIQARRLRLAIELDCDARVLQAHPSPERYGLLMLTIAQRRSVAPTLFAPMLSEPTTQLERRILAMRNRTQRVAQLTVYGSLAVAGGVLVFAASLQAADATFAAPITKRLLPTIVAPAPIVSATAFGLEPISFKPVARTETPATEHGAAAETTPPQQGNPAPRYPDLLLSANVEGTVVVDFSTDARGVPDMSTFRVSSSTHDLFTNAVKNALPGWHLAPNVNAHIPFAFVMQTASADRMTSSRRVVVDGVDAIVITGVPRGDVSANPPGVRELGPVIISGPGAPHGARTESPAAGAGAGPQRVTDNQTYFEFQVEKQVSPRPGNTGPRYPDSLRVASVEGEVLAQFVVDTLGHADMNTFKVLKSSHEMFTNAVKATLPNMQFFPAEVGGKRVKQLVQMPFQFNLSK